MNLCPYTPESTTCGLLSQELGGTTSYCNHCSQFAFRCAAGHWNRAFARYCTQCSIPLDKPAVWDMASGNPQRTGILPQMPSHDQFGTWVANIPEIKSGENLPGLLAIDGLIIMPNPSHNRLDAYRITKPQDGRNLKHQWSMEFNTPLTLGSTPIYHGLHLYSVVSGGIQKTSVIDEKTEFINNISGLDAARIEHLPSCAPLKCDINGKPIMVTGLNRGILLFNLATNIGVYDEHNFFEAINAPMSPTLCGQYIIFTSRCGDVFRLNIGTTPFKTRCFSYPKMSFSAPVSLNGLVYFEVLSDSGNRSLAHFNPKSGELSRVLDMDNEPEHGVEDRHALFTHPPLTNGRRLFLSDRYGQGVYTYDTDKGTSLLMRQLQGGAGQNRFIPHRSIVVNNRIYTAHASGLTIWEPNKNWYGQTYPLARGQSTNPRPIARPIRYGDKLFILCQDRLVCWDY